MKISRKSLEEFKSRLALMFEEIIKMEVIAEKTEQQHERLAELRDNFRLMERQYRVFSKP